MEYFNKETESETDRIVLDNIVGKKHIKAEGNQESVDKAMKEPGQ